MSCPVLTSMASLQQSEETHLPVHRPTCFIVAAEG
jgi:hypothetical protein